MSKLRTSIVAGTVILLAGMTASTEARAQVFIGPSIVGPRVVTRAVVPTVPVAPVVRPLVTAPVVTPVVRTYSSYSAGYVAPASSVRVYSSYRPAVVASPVLATVPVVTPVVRTSPVVVTTRVRPSYVPFQPVRNAIRWSRW